MIFFFIFFYIFVFTVEHAHATAAYCHPGYWLNYTVYSCQKCPPVGYKKFKGFICTNDYPGLCPSGYYCPNVSTIYECPVGSYCPYGVVKPKACPFPSVTCQTAGLQRPDTWAMSLVFLLIVFVVYYLIYSTITKRMEKSNKLNEKIAVEKEEEENRLRLIRPYAMKWLYLTRFTKAKITDDSNLQLAAQELKEKEEKKRNVSNNNYNNNTTINNTDSVIEHGNLANLASEGTLIDFSFSQKGHRSLKKLKYHFVHFLFSITGSNVATFRNYTPPSQKLDIEFSKIRLKLRSDPDNVILANVSGKFRANKVTAVMGPSGCGKTSLLSVLRGRAAYGFTFGKIFVNNAPRRSLKYLQNQTGYVPQENIMYEDLTVEENVVYSMLLFSSSKIKSKKDTEPLVTEVLAILQLHHVRGSFVGSTTSRGISGGQRKRVSVAMEIVKQPWFLILDEPTSGLDATTSVVLVNCLRLLAAKGVTVVATIHQPRYEIFQLFDDLLLLAKGGFTVYNGPILLVYQYFHNIGYKCPIKVNLADFVLDVVSGLIVRTGRHGLQALTEVLAYLRREWANKRDLTLEETLTNFYYELTRNELLQLGKTKNSDENTINNISNSNSSNNVADATTERSSSVSKQIRGTGSSFQTHGLEVSESSASFSSRKRLASQRAASLSVSTDVGAAGQSPKPSSSKRNAGLSVTADGLPSTPTSENARDSGSSLLSFPKSLFSKHKQETLGSFGSNVSNNDNNANNNNNNNNNNNGGDEGGFKSDNNNNNSGEDDGNRGRKGTFSSIKHDVEVEMHELEKKVETFEKEVEDEIKHEVEIVKEVTKDVEKEVAELFVDEDDTMDYDFEVGEAAPPHNLNPFRELFVVCERITLQTIRNSSVFVTDICLMFIVGGLVAEVFNDMEPWSNLVATTQAIQLAIALPGINVGLRVFGMDRDVLIREEESGISVTSYYIGKFFGTLPVIFLLPMVFLSSFYSIMQPRGSLADYYVALLSLQWAVQGLGVFISLIFSRKNMLTVGVVIILIMLITGGLSPPYGTITSNLGFVGEILIKISILNYSAESITLAEFRGYPPVFKQPGIQQYAATPTLAMYMWGPHYHFNGWHYSVGILFLQGAVYQFASYLYLVISNDDFYIWRRFTSILHHLTQPVVEPLKYYFFVFKDKYLSSNSSGGGGGVGGGVGGDGKNSNMATFFSYEDKN